MVPFSYMRNRHRDCYVCPRTLEEAFGKGAKLSVERSNRVEQRGHSLLFMFSIFGLAVFAGLFITGVI